jgi:uncharacterized RDD family membrane protein YckC
MQFFCCCSIFGAPNYSDITGYPLNQLHQASLLFPVPSILRRLTSMLYECFLLGAVIAVFFLLPQALIGVFSGVAVLPSVLWAHFFLLLLVYFSWFWVRGGQTLAMKTWRIQVVDTHGGTLRPMQAVLRFCAAWFGIAFCGLGILWCLVDRERQFLHDRLADTRLIELPKLPSL